MRDDHGAIAGVIYQLVQESRSGEWPDLASLAEQAGYTKDVLRQTFIEHVGISPKRFQQNIAAIRAGELLKEGATVLDAALDTGLSGPARLHDLIIHSEAMTPGMMRKRGEGLDLDYGIHSTIFGDVLIAQSVLGLCWLSFVREHESHEDALAELASDYSGARLQEAKDKTAETLDKAFAFAANGTLSSKSLGLHLRGTNFQLKVWRALLSIAPGKVTNYGALAKVLGDPKASRAVGTAVGRNPVSLLIPCHRVILSSGKAHNYRWGVDVKEALLATEATSGLNQQTHMSI